jgi:hypothetical protein
MPLRRTEYDPASVGNKEPERNEIGNDPQTIMKGNMCKLLLSSVSAFQRAYYHNEKNGVTTWTDPRV